jgi:hypothetical protein
MSKKSIIKLVVALAVVLVALIWMYTHSILEIRVEDNTDTTYSLMKSNGEVSKPQQLNGNKKVVVGANTYMVIVKSPESSFTKFITTKRFLGTTTVQATPVKESARTFVGNNPSPCMYLMGEHFYSNECYSGATGLVEHVAATKDLPTYTKSVSIAGTKSEVISMAQIKSGAIVGLAYDGENTTYSIVELNSDLSVKATYDYKPVDPTLSYSLKPFMDGFIVYNSTSGTLDYFPNLGDTPHPILIDKAKDTSLSVLYNTEIYPEQIVTAYVSKDNVLAKDPTDHDSQSNFPEKGDTKTEFVITTSDKQQHITTNQTFKTALLCAENILCTFNQHTVTIYKIKNDQTGKPYFVINKAQAIMNDGHVNRFITDQGVLALDLNMETGHYEYTFGLYRFSDVSLSSEPGSYLLSVINPSNNKVALLISPDNLVQNHIDKQVLQLANKPFVSDVSVNRNFIFIVPNYGEQVFNNFTMTYSYLPQTVRDVNAKIDELTKASDINKSEYQFVSTGYTP